MIVEVIFQKLSKIFDYQVQSKHLSQIEIGKRVLAPFGNENVSQTGIILTIKEESKTPNNKIKLIKKIIDKSPVVNQEQFELAKEVANYYTASFQEVLFSFFPSVKIPNLQKIDEVEEAPYKMNSSFTIEQQRCYNEIISKLNDQDKSFIHLIHGITGSGKTLIYLHMIQHLLQQNSGVILLLPEIALSYQFLNKLKPLFSSQLAILHSGLNPSQRLREYFRVIRGEARFVIGTRSAVFAPVRNLRMIILDEEHDSSYKEQRLYRYHTKTVATLRLRNLAIKNQESTAVVLGSATPSAESYYLAKQKTIGYSVMQLRATTLPLAKVIVNKITQGNNILIGSLLKKKMYEQIAQGNQIMLLLNRRGFSNFAYCEICEKPIECPHCSISLTYHKNKKSNIDFLKCHLCSFQKKFDSHACRSTKCKIKLVGEGTQKLENLLENLFPEIPFARLDQDSNREKNYSKDIIEAMQKGEIQILIGTQMIAKGFDLPKVTLVGIINTDIGLNIPDFRSNERTFQLLVQAGGRAGRHQQGEVVYQTMNPSHFVIQFAAATNYTSFMIQELSMRKQMSYPPYIRIMRLVVRSKNLEKLHKAVLFIESSINNLSNQNMLFSDQWQNDLPQEILGPVETSVFRIKDEYRFHFVFKDKSIKKLQDFTKGLTAQLKGEILKLDQVLTYFDLDPLDLT